MNATQTHPADSTEFLSRLRDGELSAAEVTSFEEHRRTCARCRESADSYSRALSIFRSASPRPPASDLSARILRKVRAQSPSRRPFGVTFGIDVRWAGVCAAALVVVIMAASILDEGPVPSIVLPTAREASEPESVRARLLEKSLADKEGAPAKSDRRPAARSNASPPAARPETNVPAEELGRRQLAAANEVAQERGFAAAPPEAPTDSVAAAAPPPAPAADEKRRDAPSREKDALAPGRDEQKKAAAVAQAPRSAVSADAAGGEAGAASGANAPSEADESVRVLASAADGLGSAPELERASGGAGLAALRGREFILLVESSGRVRSAVPIAPGAKLGDLRVKTKAEGEDLSPVLALRFAASDRARRLRVRLE